MPIKKKSDFEFAIQDFIAGFSGKNNKAGIGLFQTFRDTLIESISDKEKLKSFSKGSSVFFPLKGMSFLDPTYIDNIKICFGLKKSNPDNYRELVQLVDKYVRPPKNRQGEISFKEDIAGLLVFALSQKKWASARQLGHIASQIFCLSNTRVMDVYLRIKRAYSGENFDITEDIVSIVIIYFGLVVWASDPSFADAIKRRSVSSEKELGKAKEAIFKLSREVVSLYGPPVSEFLKSYPNGMLKKFLDQYSISIENIGQTPKDALVAAGSFAAIQFMPDFCTSQNI